jgi:membrane-bound lytic murein transglycosylase D
LSVWFEIKNNTIKIVLFLAVFLLFYFLEITFLKSPHRSDVAYENNNFKVFGLNIPSNLRFCDEPVPVDNFEIRTNLEGEFFTNKYWKSNSAILFNKVAKWFPYIEPILEQEGVPDDIKYVAVIESHLSNQVSPAGAVGFWQLMPSAARNYGLIVNDEVDERLDVEKATHAACKFFKEAHKRFNNWTLSAAAYNLGMGGIERAVRNQKVNNYYDLLLNQETGEFVYRLMAYKTLLANPIHYGIKRKKITYYSRIPVTTITVDSSITDLAYLAKYLKCNKTQIKLLNPWLVKGTLTNPDRQVYKLKIPQNLKKDYSMYYVDLISEDGYMYDREEPETIEAPKADSLTVKNN